jgi:uncharacterized protein YwgA
MNKRDQISFVRKHSKRLSEEVVNLIQDGKIPAEWDGNEFRIMLADRHIEATSISKIKKEPNSHRAKFFRNYVITNL